MKQDEQLISDCLGRLSAALTHLDHESVDNCVAELEALGSDFGTEAMTATGLAALGFQLRSAMQLASSASGLYDDWSRVVSPPAGAYAPDGAELVPVRRKSMNVDG